MPTEWLRVMLEEVARKRREDAEARAAVPEPPKPATPRAPLPRPPPR